MTTTETTTHPRPLVHGRSGDIYCAGCLAHAATVAELDAKPCRADNYED